MKEIPLTQGKVAIVDDADFEWLSQWKWCCASMGGDYAARGESYGTGTKLIYMHRVLIMAGPNQHIHHKNGNSLDNRRANLAAISRSKHKGLHRHIPSRYGLRARSDFPSTFPAQMRSMRKMRGLTLNTLSNMCHISVAFLCRVEQGKYKPSVDSEARIRAALNWPQEESA